jgi:hypothetical protein
MDERARAILDEARAALDRTAHVVVEHRDHDDDDALARYRRAPEPKLSADDVTKMIRVELAKMPRALTVDDVERVLAAHSVLTPKAAATIIGEVRAELRREFTAEIDRLKSEFDLRLSALLQATDKIERGLSDRAEVIDMRSKRA